MSSAFVFIGHRETKRSCCSALQDVGAFAYTDLLFLS